MKDPEPRTVFAGVDGRAEAQLPDWYAEKRDIDDSVSFAEAIRDLPRASEASVAYRNPHTDEWVETDRFNALDAESSLAEGVDSDLREGIELIDTQIRSILEREGSEEIDTSGEVDPQKHRVVETVPSAGTEPGEIVDVHQLGYRQDDRVIREAQVVVASDQPANGAGDFTGEGSQDNRGADGS